MATTIYEIIREGDVTEFSSRR